MATKTKKLEKWNPKATAELIRQAIELEEDQTISEVETAESREEAIKRLETIIDDVEAALICVRGPGPSYPKLDRRELATILAALRYFQVGVQDRDPNRSAATYEIATDCGTLKPLTHDEICDLCERLNCVPIETDQVCDECRSNGPRSSCKCRKGGR